MFYLFVYKILGPLLLLLQEKKVKIYLFKIDLFMSTDKGKKKVKL